MYIGGFSTVLLFPAWSGTFPDIMLLFFGLVLITPAGVDGTTQMFSRRESNNILRVMTGILLGIGIPLIIWQVIELLI